VAPRHLILQSRGDGWQIATLDLHAKVTVNDEPVTGLRLLRDGDRIRVGDGVVFVWREANAPPQKGPWLGLLLIFLLVAMLSILFAIYRFDTVYFEDFMPVTVAPETIQQPAPSSEPDALLHPVATSPSGRPVYELTVPPVEGSGP